MDRDYRPRAEKAARTGSDSRSRSWRRCVLVGRRIESRAHAADRTGCRTAIPELSQADAVSNRLKSCGISPRRRRYMQVSRSMAVRTLEQVHRGDRTRRSRAFIARWNLAATRSCTGRASLRATVRMRRLLEVLIPSAAVIRRAVSTSAEIAAPYTNRSGATPCAGTGRTEAAVVTSGQRELYAASEIAPASWCGPSRRCKTPFRPPWCRRCEVWQRPQASSVRHRHGSEDETLAETETPDPGHRLVLPRQTPLKTYS